MPLYTQPPKELLLALIKESNPNLPLPITTAGLSFSPPKVVPLVPGAKVNTEITMTMRGGSGYVKSTTVRYRRLSLSTLFRGLDAEVHKYTAKGPGEYPFDIYGLLKEINLRFGLNLTQDDVINTWFPWQNDKFYPDRRSSQAVLKAKTDSLVWLDQVTLRWVSDKQSIGDMILKLDLPGRTFPGGKSIISTKYSLDCATYAADFGEFTKNMESAWITSVPFGTVNGIIRPIHDEVLAGIKLVTGETYTYDPPPAAFGLGGIMPVRYTLPNAAIPEANSKDFNRVVVFPYPVDGVWGVGRLLLHYNA